VSDDLDRRTHEPTPKRVEDFRKKGELATSKDLTMVATVMGGAIVGAAFAQRSLGALGDHLRGTLGGLDATTPMMAIQNTGGAFVTAVMPVALGAVAGYLVSVVQRGMPLSLKFPTPDFTKPFNPQNIVGIVSPKAAAGRLLKSLAKLIVVGLAAYVALEGEFARFIAEPVLDAHGTAHGLGAALRRLLMIAGFALAVLAVIEFFQAKRQLMKKMRMTPEEVKKEYKESEGDPQIRQRRRRRMREISRRRLVQAVEGADVVVVNPTTYAVALRYRAGEDRAPKVVAKGKGAVAERIREIARKNGVPILAQPPLARLLHKVVPEGREIPSNVYHAVAEVLAYVFKLRRSRGLSVQTPTKSTSKPKVKR
jgi:flagellar biosynthetic protein FlhB